MIRGLGCDVCEIARMEQMLQNPRCLTRWFTAEEQAYIAARKNAAQTAAGLFAAKEALVKAMGTGFGALMPQDVAITHTADGAPCFALNEKTRAALSARGAEHVHLSISHDGGVAMAVAIIE